MRIPRAAYALLFAVGLSFLVGAIAARTGSDEISWEVSALVFTALATLLLAFATYVLANQAIEEHRRRPRLTLLADDEKIQTHVEGEEVYVRLFVRNGEGLRASTGTRVLVERYYAPGAEKPTTFGSPALGWTSAAAGAHDEAAVIFSGSERVVDLGILRRDQDRLRRELQISLPLLWRERVVIPDRRDYVGTGAVIRLVVGSDEATARFYTFSSVGMSTRVNRARFWPHS